MAIVTRLSENILDRISSVALNALNNNLMEFKYFVPLVLQLVFELQIVCITCCVNKNNKKSHKNNEVPNENETFMIRPTSSVD
jgi:hypothetical protein